MDGLGTENILEAAQEQLDEWRSKQSTSK